MDFSGSDRGLTGKRLYILIGVWLMLIIGGVACLVLGATLDRGAKEEPTAQATAPAVPTAEPTPVLPTLPPTVAPTIPPVEEVFGYGIAINGIGGVDMISYWIGQVKSLGLGWVKQQVKWGAFEGNPGQMDWSGYDAVIDEANRQGIKVMLSVVDAPHWARDPADLQNNEVIEGAPPGDLSLTANFLGQLVDRYRGRIHAIEVWNEQNLDREWDTVSGVNPERYVEMLRLSYQAIKLRDPNIIVISGALSPVGVTFVDPNTGRVVYMDDFEYFDRMVAAGFLNYCDCVGAHHNGINLPPNVAWDEGYNDPTAQFRGPFDNPDHSWSFKSTLWGYHDRIAAAGSDKPLCVTEFGWASAEGFDGYPPGFEFALDNTLAEQAQWDVEAFQLMRQWGFVRLAFLWNLNYSQLGWGPQDPNAPYALIDFQGIARPAFGAIGAMDKP